MESTEQVIYDPFVLSHIISFLDDHFDLLSLSLASKFHRQAVLDSCEGITCRLVDEIMEIPKVFPGLRKLDLSPVAKKLSDSVFTTLIPKLSNLQILKIQLSLEPDFQIERTSLASLQTLSKLTVLDLDGCFLDDQIAKQIGSGCKLLQDVTLTGSRGALTNNGVNDLLLSSSFGLRRLSLNVNRIFKDDPLSVIIKCSTLTSLVLTNEFKLRSSIQDLNFPNLKLNNIRELKVGLLVLHPLGNFVDCFVKAIIRAGSPLQIVKVYSRLSESTLMKLFNCTTLQSLYFNSALDDFLLGQFFSKNHGMISLQLSNQQPPVWKAMVERMLSFEGIRDERDQNIDNVIEVLDFFSRNNFDYFRCLFEFNQRFSFRVQFLREIQFTARFSVEETSYQGLYELLSMCKLLRKVHVNCFVHETMYTNPLLCRAFGALNGCPNLEVLCAPVGDETLRRILNGVKGLRELEVHWPMEDFTDEALLLLKGNSPFLRCLSLTYERPNDGGITDRGLGYLSFCSQLRTLKIVDSNIEGSGLFHFEKRCLWLNHLIIQTDVNNGAKISRIIRELEFQNRGCSVTVRVNTEGVV